MKSSSRSPFSARPGLLAVLLLMPSALPAADRFVTSRNDSGPGSLRAAITAANNAGGEDHIIIALIPDGGITGTTITLQPASPLPPITDTTVFDATTVNPNVPAGTPEVVIDGVNAGAGAIGLDIRAVNCTVRGLSLVRWSGTGLAVQNGATCIIEGCWVGMHPSQALMGNGRGVWFNDSAACTLGGFGVAGRCVISGNTSTAVHFFNSTNAAGGHIVRNCRIGTTPDGEFASANGGDGVRVEGGRLHIIGGTAGENTIGRNSIGISLLNTEQAEISNNRVGLSTAGNDVGNRSTGLFIAGCRGVTVQGNTIGYNAGRGVWVARDEFAGLSSGVSIANNQIGRGPGISPAPNDTGILVDGGPGTVITGNDVSGNGNSQIVLTGDGGDDCVLTGNSVSSGLNITTAFRGIELNSTKRVRVGGLAPGEANNISLNRFQGIRIATLPTLPPAPARIASDNVILGNFIGGIGATRNRGGGIVLEGAQQNVINGNYVYGNAAHDILLYGPQTTGNQLTGNVIGAAPGNAEPTGSEIGISLSGAVNNIIGTAAAPNAVLNCTTAGVFLAADTSGNLARGNSIRGNAIGVTISGQAGWVIQTAGLRLDQPGGDNIVGGAGSGEGNTFAGNVSAIELSSKVAPDGVLTVQGNRFGTLGTADAFRNGSALRLSGTGGVNFTGNTVSFCSRAPVELLRYQDSSPDSVQVTANTFTSNSGIPIDLDGDGPTPQDGQTGDADTGPNGLQDYPEILSVRVGTNHEITGRLRSTPLMLFRVHLYAGPEVPLGSSTFTEPQTYLGVSPTFLTDAAGHAYWRVSVSAAIPAGSLLTATATRSDAFPGATSEFSPGTSFAALRDRPWGVLDIRRDGNDILVDVPTLPGRPTALRTNTVTSSPGTILNEVSGTGGIITFRHTDAISGAPRRFYRAEETAF